MLTHRKKARAYLDDSSRTNFWTIIREAKLSPADQQILGAKFVDGKSIVEISSELGYTTEKINRTIAAAYDKVVRLL